MADSKQIIELEVKQVQEQLIKLIQERKNLQEEFEQLTGSSHQLLQEIQEDPTSASERKLHKYEAEKRRIEEKLEVLESEISEKAKRITLLDSKAGLFLQQIEKLQDFEACLDEARAQVSEATAKRLRLEESLTENLGAGATLTAQIDQLRRHNQDLQDTVQCHHREKEETDKRLAALELSNERSKNQVVTMEQSQKELQERLNTMSQDKERLLRQFEEGSTEGVIEVLVKEKQELEERLTREKETQLQDYKARNKALQEQLEGLVDVRSAMISAT
ncbi:hypothetical protein GWK47_027428 [Chionoecetes opilio]|uniref:Uncharacterized protein n=1 Tax=Chionoecetes opilio TaxID=41210 RepID=A0A8J8W9E8_CHIOP|nr:hypothetical protein GWK47_027428 [Chionoecetes opilio]